MAPGRRTRVAGPAGGGWGRAFLKPQRRPGRSSVADPSVPGRPVAGVLGRRPPARQVIVRSGAKGACEIAADPRVLARRPRAHPRSLGARQPRLFVHRSRGAVSHVAPSPGSGCSLALGSASWRSLCSPTGARAPRFCCAPGGSWLRHWAPDAHGSAAAGGWPTVTGGGDGCEVSGCGWNRALRRTPSRRDGEPGRSWGRGQRAASSGGDCAVAGCPAGGSERW